MDKYLIEYLQSGKAWVLVGSGPSIDMGYPSWEQFATFAIELVKTESKVSGLSNINKAFFRGDFPSVFQQVKDIIGGPRLIQFLREKNRRSRSGRIYPLIAQWPVPVYLTTNFDDEIQRNLASLGESYNVYSNSEEYMGLLIPESNGIVVKLHGDLTQEHNTILTTESYDDISSGENWNYWRTRMASIFQMNRMIIIGHSLSDRNIRHILETAKQGTSIERPICWLAPDVTYKDSKEFLDRYKIRLIPYDNRSGDHKNLVKLVQTISDFVPPRTVVTIQEQVARVSLSPMGDNSAAPGFFVFNTFLEDADYETKRMDIIASAIQSALPELAKLGEFL